MSIYIKLPYMTSMGNRIRKRRKDLKLTQKHIAEHVGVKTPSVTQWESGEYKPNGENLLRLAAVLETTPEWITDGEGLAGRVSPPAGNTERGPAIRGSVPLISEVQAGKWTEIVDSFQPGDAEEWRETTSNVSSRSFALRVKGDSMINSHGAPSFPPGCVLIVDPDIDAYNGAFVIAKMEGEEEATFKKFVKDGPNFYLMPLNYPKYDKIICGETCRIVGVVKKAEFDLLK